MINRDAERYLEEMKNKPDNSDNASFFSKIKNILWGSRSTLEKALISLSLAIIIGLVSAFSYHVMTDNSNPQPAPSLVGEGAQETLPKYQPGMNTAESAPVSMDIAGKKGINIEAVDLIPGSNPNVEAKNNPCAPDEGDIRPVPNDCALVPPERDIDTVAAWYQRSAQPGSSNNGSVVITAHINYANINGVGTYFTHLKKGETVTLHTNDGEVHKYQVVEPMQLTPKDDPVAFNEIGDRTFNKVDGPEQLILITCAGKFIPGSPLGYQENGIVILNPIVD